MIKPNWANAEDYAYAKNLDDNGWAWEFLRRSVAYRQAYREVVCMIEAECAGDWSKQLETHYYPEKIPHENERAWAIRVEGEGTIAEILTASKRCARQWQLKDMYDPDLLYTPESVYFVHAKKFPLFYASGISFDGDLSAGEETFLASIYSDQALNSVRPIEELLLSPEGKNMVYVAYDMDGALVDQIAVARAVLKRFQEVTVGKVQSSKKRNDKWLRYLRVLDAARSETGMPWTQIIKIIQPEGTHGSPGSSESRYISDYAVSTLQQAQRMADTGFRNLIAGNK